MYEFVWLLDEYFSQNYKCFRIIIKKLLLSPQKIDRRVRMSFSKHASEGLFNKSGLHMLKCTLQPTMHTNHFGDLPSQHVIRVACGCPHMTKKIFCLHKTSPPFYIKLTAWANEGVCVLCSTNSQVLHSINTDLIRQRVLLPVLSCVLSHRQWRRRQHTTMWLLKLETPFAGESLSIFRRYINMQSVGQVSLLFSCHRAGLWVVAVNMRLPWQHSGGERGVTYSFFNLAQSDIFLPTKHKLQESVMCFVYTQCIPRSG